MQIDTHPEFDKKLDAYDELQRARLEQLRNLIIDVARAIGVAQLEESLKWGEPSFVTGRGSTVRIGANATQYAVYFHCQSRLVPTFRRVFAGTLQFEGDRAILFDLAEDPPEEELKRCFAAALQYHDVKHLPELGL